ncbi:hypothetical protein ONZ45_g13399 [Pleurotus djamor]|nr:hypothetical protein ONZ45_g13399 [Pleurotus djamor]
MTEQNTVMLKLISQQAAAIREQTTILKEIATRQAEQDFSNRPIPQVPLRNAGAWNPLLVSTQRRIAPILERWRGGLDTLLIFIGLFSAIVTAFLVESLSELQVDQPARTNELLVNLTSVLVAIHTNGNLVTVNQAQDPIDFTPDSDSIRVNILWSLSLIFSLCLAALAVVGRAVLSKLTRPGGDSISRLTDIHNRWPGARRLLGRHHKILPLALVIPVTLFVLGYLDRLIALSLQPQAPIRPIFYTAIIGCITVGLVACLMISTLIHGWLYPYTSPFRYAAAPSLDFTSLSFMSNSIAAYHHTIQSTFDDALLDESAAALQAVLQYSNPYMDSPCSDERSLKPISHTEMDTLLHLLSPESSFKSNITVAQILLNCTPVFMERAISWSQKAQLLSALLKCIQHEHLQRNDVEHLLKSPLLSAMASVIQSQWKLLTLKWNIVDFSVNPIFISGPQSILVLLTAHFISQTSQDRAVKQVYHECTAFAHEIIQSLVDSSARGVYDISTGARFTSALIRPYPTHDTPQFATLTSIFGRNDATEERNDPQTFVLFLLLLHATVDYDGTTKLSEFNRICHTIISWMVSKPEPWLFSGSECLTSGAIVSPSSMNNITFSHRLLKVMARTCNPDYHPDGASMANLFIKNLLHNAHDFLSINSDDSVPLPLILFCDLSLQFLEHLGTNFEVGHPHLKKFNLTMGLLHDWLIDEILQSDDPVAMTYLIPRSGVPLVAKLSPFLPPIQRARLIGRLLETLQEERLRNAVSEAFKATILQSYLQAVSCLDMKLLEDDPSGISPQYRSVVLDVKEQSILTKYPQLAAQIELLERRSKERISKR